MCECWAFHGTSVILESTHTYAFGWGLTCNSRWSQTMGLTANSHWSSDHAFDGKFKSILAMGLTRNSQCSTAWLAPNILQSWVHERTREVGIVALNPWANSDGHLFTILFRRHSRIYAHHLFSDRTFSIIRFHIQTMRFRSYIFVHTFWRTNLTRSIGSRAVRFGERARQK